MFSLNSKIVLLPSVSDESYRHAASVFAEMYNKASGGEISVCETDDGVSDLFVIGSDSVNDFVMGELLSGNIKSLGIRYGTDDYSLVSYLKEGRRIVILAGGRARSTLYAVYDFFETFYDCHYFWDGDIIPKKGEISLSDFHIKKSPRFEFRGLRYFAHRGLKRFQAEHWALDDWKRELDYLAKRRLNFFMLRIGMDDVWQRAFPDIVKYPDGYFMERELEGYDDRSDFWTLKYRGELREQILCYARRLDMIYPTDCGTMTHWYSRTPKEFLESEKPTFLPQNDNAYLQNDTGKVWDFRDKRNMDNYMRLTETMVNEYDKQCNYFHTIGLAERNVYADPKKSHELKLMAYRRIAESISRRYPGSKLFIASWDFCQCRWTNDEVRALIAELDPEKTIILDYTSDMNDPNDSFINWGVVNNFPWIFGLFHAYESETELRGSYDRIAERLKVAANDKYCKGMILWPEMSHSDPIVLEYLAENAWSPLEKPIESLVFDFCGKRYGKNANKMNDVWQTFLPFMMQGDWGGFSRRAEDEPGATEYYETWCSHTDMWVKPLHAIRLASDMRFKKQIAYKAERMKAELENVVSAIRALASDSAIWENEFSRRDAIDIIRTALSRFINIIFATAIYENDAEKISEKRKHYFVLLDIMRDLLSLSDDFSLFASLKALADAAPTNPLFERTLKQNISHGYCRQACYELIDSLFKPESELIMDWMLGGKREDEAENIRVRVEKFKKKFMETPLSKLAERERLSPCEVASRAAETLKILKNVL